MENKTKTCSTCKQIKDLDCFYKATRGILGRQARCKPCAVIARREYSSRKPEKNWVMNLRRMGLTVQEYEEMFSSQNGLCFSCGCPETIIDKRVNKLRRLAIDHDHSCCGKQKACKSCIRGLLCQSCNQALGLLKDDATRVWALYVYAQKNSRFWG